MEKRRKRRKKKKKGTVSRHHHFFFFSFSFSKRMRRTSKLCLLLLSGVFVYSFPSNISDWLRSTTKNTHTVLALPYSLPSSCLSRCWRGRKVRLRFVILCIDDCASFSFSLSLSLSFGARRSSGSNNSSIRATKDLHTTVLVRKEEKEEEEGRWVKGTTTQGTPSFPHLSFFFFFIIFFNSFASWKRRRRFWQQVPPFPLPIDWGAHVSCARRFSLAVFLLRVAWSAAAHQFKSHRKVKY